MRLRKWPGQWEVGTLAASLTWEFPSAEAEARLRYSHGGPSVTLMPLSPLKTQASGFPLKLKEPQHKGYMMFCGLHGGSLSLEMCSRGNSVAAFLMQTKLTKMPVCLCSGAFAHLWASRRKRWTKQRLTSALCLEGKDKALLPKCCSLTPRDSSPGLSVRPHGCYEKKLRGTMLDNSSFPAVTWCWAEPFYCKTQ